MTGPRWTVHKFGGTCLADAEGFRNAARRVLEAPSPAEAGHRPAVVVSAMAGITDGLIECVERAAARDEGFRARLAGLGERSEAAARELLGPEGAEPLVALLRAEIADLRDVLRGVSLTRTAGEATLELVAGHGELWSARLLAAHLAAGGEAASWLDAREVLVVTPGETGPVVDWDAASARLRSRLPGRPGGPLVVTGYVACTPEGIPTTLKRNGSDFSASIFAALLEATAITIWTDVDGVMSADPRRVPEARVLPRLSYSEAMELAYFGAKVLHPHTMAPAVAGRIPIRIRNAFRPGAPGTLIHAPEAPAAPAAPRAAVKGFSSIESVVLVNVEGTGMIGVPGIAHRLFGALREAGISVVMISQASSEHSICFAVPEAQAAAARTAVERAFFAEIHHGRIQTVEVSRPGSVLAAVGDDMVRTPGVAGRFFGALAKAGVNVRAVAQGSSERNISAVVDREDSTRALRAVHAGFTLSDRTLSVGLIGPGRIGSALLAQIGAQGEHLRARFGIDIRVRGILRRDRMVLSDPGIAPDRWSEALERDGVPPDLEAFTEHVRPGHLPHAVMVDTTAGASVPARYAAWLERGIHVVTPNKKAGSGPLAEYRRLRELGGRLSTHYLYEATVGAGLPVITTLRDLIRTGDRVERIEGVLSGTVSYLFNELKPEAPFSGLVREARRRGYTEPDPREDLSGRDVARKAVILAREMGLEVELDAVETAGLVPDGLDGADTVDAFLDALAAHDPEMEALRAGAEAAGEVIRYTAVVEAGAAPRVGPARYPADHPFARVRGTDNVIAFTTARYAGAPLLVQGPGAGPEVTAGGVFADLLRLASYLGASE